MRRPAGAHPRRSSSTSAPGFVLAADVGHARTRVAVCDLSGAPRAERVVPAGIDEPPEALLGLVADRFRELLADRRRRSPPRCGASASGWRRAGTTSRVATGWRRASRSRPWSRPRSTPWPWVSTGRTGGRSSICCSSRSGATVGAGSSPGAGSIAARRAARATSGTCGCPTTTTSCAAAATPAAWRRSRAATRVAARLRAHGVAAANAEDVVTLVHAGEPLAVQAVRRAGRDLGERAGAVHQLLQPGRDRDRRRDGGGAPAAAGGGARGRVRPLAADGDARPAHVPQPARGPGRADRRGDHGRRPPARAGDASTPWSDERAVRESLGAGCPGACEACDACPPSIP